MLRIRYLLVLASSLFIVLSPFTGQAQNSAALPPNLLNRNLLPPSPDAAALGRFGEVPVSLYTGVPSITIPLLTLPGRTVSVPLSLQYHGGGIRPDQIAPWTGMNWTLNAGGAIIRTCRGTDDFDETGFARHGDPLPLNITKFCYNGATDANGADPLNYYEYLKHVFEGTQDSQPDVFTFNFMGYSGKIIFDQYGTPYTIPSQALKIASPLTLGSGMWKLTTPDGNTYTFSAVEFSSTDGSNGRYGHSAWYLTHITTAQQEHIDFIYKDYNYSIYYFNSSTNAPLQVPSMSTQRVLDGQKNTFDCETCPKELDTSPRPVSLIQGKYLQRIISATHRVDFLSSADRLDQPGMRRLNTIRIKCLADSTRYQEYRFGFAYYNESEHDRLFLQQVQKAGIEANGRETLESPYVFTYVPEPRGNGPYSAPTRGTYAVDRWGFYNGVSNRYPFLRDNQQVYQVLAATSRETNPNAVKFGLLQQIRYPTGGTSSFEFESNDFSNFAGPSYTESTSQLNVCRAIAPAIACGGQSDTASFVLTHAQTVSFLTSANVPAEDPDAITEFDASGLLYQLRADGTRTALAQIEYLVGRVPRGQETQTVNLPAGRYWLRATTPSEPRAIQVNILVTYVVRHFTDKKWPGGGTRIKRTVTYDGLDHRRDQIKEYYYDTNNHTRSTGRLIHQPVFHSTFKNILLSHSGAHSCMFTTTPEDPGLNQYTCNYVIHSADDLAAASGSAQGSAVGYDTVSVVQRTGTTSLRTTSIFHNIAATSIDLSDQATELQGFMPTNFDERNGLLLQTLDYAVTDNGDAFRSADARLLRRVVQQYGNDSIAEKKIIGVSIGGSLGQLLQESVWACRGAYCQPYSTTVGWWPLTQAEETRYDDQGRSSTTTTRFLYRSTKHYQPYCKQVWANNKVYETRYKYALDYEPTADTSIPQLQSQFVVTAPLEEQSWVQQLGQPAQWLGGKVTQFATTSAGVIVPHRIYQATVPSPISRLVEPRSAAGLYTSLLPSAVYQSQAMFAYEPTGLLREQALVHDRPTAYLWGYHDLRAIAEVRNAGASQIAFTSFEPESAGSWNYNSTPGQGLISGQSRTGQWAYQLQGGRAVTRPGLPAGTYLLSFWATAAPQVSIAGVVQALPASVVNAGDWQHYLVRLRVGSASTVQVSAPASSSCLLDEMRLHPVEAQMSSVTIDGLGNKTSQTGPDSRTVTYEYDALGRLMRTRDEQGRMLSQQQYHYGN